ncbi:MAG: type IV pilin protein, partial [Gemmatimonadota bacterium]
MLRDTRGFTLIELLIVVVIIGILSAFAIPKFAVTKEKSYLATMKSDLRNLVTVQEGYLAEAQTYYAGAVPGAGFTYR